jgi:hypothetical protein
MWRIYSRQGYRRRRALPRQVGGQATALFFEILMGSAFAKDLAFAMLWRGKAERPEGACG